MTDNILLISPDYPPPLIGGSLVYMNNLVEHSNHTFTILTDEKDRVSSLEKKYIEKKYIVDSNSPSLFALLRMYLFLFLYLRKIIQFNLIILNISAIGNGFFALLLSFFNKKTIIMAYAEELTVTIHAKGIKGAIKRLFLRGYRKASMIISVSNFAKSVLTSQLDVDCPIHVIPTPLHDSKLDKNFQYHTRKRHGILSVGRLIKRKGFNYLLKAFKEVINELPEARLTIIGDGPEYEFLMDYISENSLSKHVSIFKNVSNDFLNKQYREHEIFILGNLMLENGDCEGAPNVLIEAAAYGLPSIAGIEGGTSDVVKDGVTGILLDPTDTNNMSTCIVSLLRDRKKLQSMAESSILKVKKYHNKTIAGETFGKYLSDCINLY